MIRQGISILFIFLFLSEGVLHAQKNNEWELGSFHFSSGSIWAHSKKINYIEGKTFSGEARVYFNPKSDNFWINTFKNTRFGFAFSYIYTNNYYIGSLGAVSMFFQPTIFKTKHLHFYPHLGLGLSYSPKYYSSDTNSYLNKNTVLCTPVNAYFHGNFNLDYIINNRIQAGVFIGLQHASNGALRLSNFGLNIIGGGLNLTYRFLPQEYKQQQSLNKNITINKKINPYISMGIGWRNAARDSKDYYTNIMADIGVYKYLSPRNIIETELNVLNRQGTIAEGVKEMKYDQYYALTIGHELLIKRIGFVTKVGCYFYNTESKEENHLFAKLGIRAYLSHNFYGSILLLNKTSNADFILLGLGYRFGKGGAIL